MDQFSFALIAVFGVPFGAIVLLFLGHRLTPRSVWFSFPVQTVVGGLFLGALATPILVFNADAEGDYFEDESELVRTAFALPGTVTVDRQRDRTVRLGDCWRNAVNWRSDVEFASAEDFDSWYASEGWRDGIVEQIADYFGVPVANISVAEGALDLRPHDPQYALSQDHGSYSQNVRILEFYDPFVCAAVERDEGGAISLRPCDPVALTTDTGNAGRVIVNPDRRDRTLEGSIYYAQGPHTCTNPVRRAVNDALGLDHPEGGEPNTQMGSVLPSR